MPGEIHYEQGAGAPRIIETFDLRGIAERFLLDGRNYPIVSFHDALDISDFPARHNYVLVLWQNRIERILADWVGVLSVPIHRGFEVSGFTQDNTGVDVELSNGRPIRAQYLVGYDGGCSLIRKVAGIEFRGWDSTTSWLIAEAEKFDEPEWGLRYDDVGSHAIGKVDDSGQATTDGPVQVFGLLDEAKALLLNFGTPGSVEITPWTDRVRSLEVRCTNAWEPPAIGAVSAPLPC